MSAASEGKLSLSTPPLLAAHEPILGAIEREREREREREHFHDFLNLESKYYLLFLNLVVRNDEVFYEYVRVLQHILIGLQMQSLQSLSLPHPPGDEKHTHKRSVSGF